MFHLIWYILIGLIAGVIAKSVMHVHLTLLWTTVLGIIGSIIGGAVTHMFAPPRDARFHPAGLIFSTLGAFVRLLQTENPFPSRLACDPVAGEIPDYVRATRTKSAARSFDFLVFDTDGVFSRFNARAELVGVHLREFCAEKKNLRGVVNPEQ